MITRHDLKELQSMVSVPALSILLSTQSIGVVLEP
jgi:hypothetical protein